jgi:undecaprenyl phosphate N,N'-diacetylbacillosamine 1-phosphate transferase
MYRKYVKRPLDLIMALVGLIVLSPVLLTIAILVRIKLGSPVIFRQPRPGLQQKVFIRYKFRTMTDERDQNGELLPDEVRLTSFGKLLRSTSLDELPELWNILKGEMSFVGPRPLLVEYLPLYSSSQKKRHSVRPGLTGLAQVSGRNAISWEDKFDLDIEYVSSVTFAFDSRIVLLTLKKVLFKEGINSDAAATMEHFQGTKVADANE